MSQITLITKFAHFIDDQENFIVKLRFRDGLDQQNANYFIELLTQLKQELQNKSMIEKRIAYLLIDVVPSLLMTVDYYQGEEREKINLMIDNVSNKIIECFMD